MFVSELSLHSLFSLLSSFSIHLSSDLTVFVLTFSGFCVCLALAIALKQGMDEDGSVSPLSSVSATCFPLLHPRSLIPSSAESQTNSPLQPSKERICGWLLCGSGWHSSGPCSVPSSLDSTEMSWEGQCIERRLERLRSGEKIHPLVREVIRELVSYGYESILRDKKYSLIKYTSLSQGNDNNESLSTTPCTVHTLHNPVYRNLPDLLHNHRILRVLHAAAMAAPRAPKPPYLS